MTNLTSKKVYKILVNCKNAPIVLENVVKFKKVSEFSFTFLELCPSHYKNQPNDLQLLSDAPAHHLFVLCPPVTSDQTRLPVPLVVLQVALEGRISKQSIAAAHRQGDKWHGDMIPWIVTEQFRQEFEKK